MFHKIIWAIDPTVEEFELQHKAATALKALTRNLETTIEPVHVLRPEPVLVPMEYAEREHKRLLVSIQDWLNRGSVSAMLPPRVLDSALPDTSAQVNALLNYAYESDCDLIAASTHARKGIEKLLLGSFVEKLLFRSRLPILTVNPATRAVSVLQAIVFPTDFGPTARAFYERMVELAPKLGARMIVLHKLETLVPMTISTMDILPVVNTEELVQKSREKAKIHAKKESEDWGSLARRRHIPTDLVVDETTASVEEAILTCAKSLNSGLA